MSIAISKRPNFDDSSSCIKSFNNLKLSTEIQSYPEKVEQNLVKLLQIYPDKKPEDLKCLLEQLENNIDIVTELINEQSMEHPKIDMKFNPILNRFTPIKERTKKIIKRQIQQPYSDIQIEQQQPQIQDKILQSLFSKLSTISEFQTAQYYIKESFKFLNDHLIKKSSEQNQRVNEENRILKKGFIAQHKKCQEQEIRFSKELDSINLENQKLKQLNQNLIKQIMILEGKTNQELNDYYIY